MIILDLDRASPRFEDTLRDAMPIRGLWGVKRRDSLHRYGIAALTHLPFFPDVFADHKIAEVAASIRSVVDLYAQSSRPPKWLSVSGEVSEDGLRIALEARGAMDILYVPLLSDQAEDEIFSCYGQMPENFLFHRLAKARRAGLTHTTCPAWLLPKMSEKLKAHFAVRLATGTRSDQVPADEHKKVQPLEFAYEEGATHVVVGREVTLAPDPMDALYRLCERACPFLPAQLLDKPA